MENQQLQKAYNSFCESSRHLTKEKKGLKYGNKPLDTSQGLVNIVRDYFLYKARINEFLRLCPHSPIIIKLIDTDDTLLRLEIILKTFKDSLSKIDKVPVECSKKRKHEHDDLFDVSQTNTSTPEIVNPSKRMRKSLTTPFLTLSANKENKIRSIDKSTANRNELSYNTSSDSSEKENEEDDNDDMSHSNQATASPIPQVLKANEVHT